MIAPGCSKLERARGVLIVFVKSMMASCESVLGAVW